MNLASKSLADILSLQWYFAAGSANQSSLRACQMGFYLPYETRSQTGDPGSTGEPSQAQCKNIFRAILDANAAHNPQWLGASINLRTFPAQGQFELPGAEGTGRCRSSFKG